MLDTKQILKEYIHDLSDIPQTDSLVTIQNQQSVHLNWLERIDPFELANTDQLAGILKQAQVYVRESDVNPLCLVFGLLDWNYQNTAIQTPCLLIPLVFKIDKVKNTITFIPQLDKAALNPFVRFAFSEQYDEILPEYSPELFENIIDSLKERIQLRSISADLKSDFFLGNFHYHRFHLLRELDGIFKSEQQANLLQTFLGTYESKAEHLVLPPDLLTPADRDQLAVFEAFQQENVVVQGPPGTGKSQVLTNILGKCLFLQQKTLVLSEKKVALEVLVKKLASVDLNDFAFIVHSQSATKDLIAHLKNSWNKLELMTAAFPTNLRLSEQRLSSLQLLMDRLNQVDLMGGVSLEEFDILATETPFEKVQLTTSVPLISEWLQHKKTLQALSDAWGDLACLNGIKAIYFQHFDGDQMIRKLQQQLDKLKELLEAGTWEEIQFLEKIIGRCQLIENEWFKLYTQLQSKPREKKRFENAVVQFSFLESALKEQEQELKVWKQIPSKSQIESWENATGFFGKRKRSKAIQQLLNDRSIDAQIAIDAWNKWWSIKSEFLALSKAFVEWGIEPTAGHVAASWSFYQSISKESESALAELTKWTSEKRKAVLRLQTAIFQLNNELKRNFKLKDKTPVSAFLAEKLRHFERHSSVFKSIQSLPEWVFTLVEMTTSVAEMQALVLKGNRAKTMTIFPELIQFNGTELKHKLEQLIACEEEEYQLFSQQIVMKIKERFDYFEQLLRLPSTKVKGDEKELRSRLKKGKALLVKEFGKTRHHPSIRTLLESDAKDWIQLLLPIWLSTPNQVADHFPLQAEIFDVLVVDEASQMPMPNVFGSMFRSKKALIAGDEQQMSPSSFFGKKLRGHDVLHQANFSFKRLALRHHYRSIYPELIAFSNKHFYKNELIVYPSSHKQVALHRHFCKDGVFVERTNVAEAKAIAHFLEQFDFQQTIGIVAFSEEQVKCIWKHCSTHVQLKITEGQDQNTVFLKSLEQVQGDEAEVLFVSLAYARNQDGEFYMRFGPLNQEMGYKRLNVLFTRAKLAFHLFCSVSAVDFTLSSNESVNLLRLFLHDLEQQTTHQAIQSELPYGITTSKQNGNQLTLKSIYKSIPDACDLLTFYRVMKARGWQINF